MSTVPSRVSWEQKYVKEVVSDKIILDADELREIIRLAIKAESLTEADYFGCISTTKIANGKPLAKNDVDLIVKAIMGLKKI